MVKVFQADSASELQEMLNATGSDLQIISIYSMGQKHFAWIKIKEKKGTK